MYQHAKNQLIPSVYSWETFKFSPETDWPHPLLTMPNQNIFDQLLIFVNLYQHTKNEAVSSICFREIYWFKNPAILLAESILVYISGTKFFPNTRLFQERSKGPPDFPGQNRLNVILGQFQALLLEILRQNHWNWGKLGQCRNSIYET